MHKDGGWSSIGLMQRDLEAPRNANAQDGVRDFVELENAQVH